MRCRAATLRRRCVRPDVAPTSQRSRCCRSRSSSKSRRGPRLRWHQLPAARRTADGQPSRRSPVMRSHSSARRSSSPFPRSPWAATRGAVACAFSACRGSAPPSPAPARQSMPRHRHSRWPGIGARTSSTQRRPRPRDRWSAGGIALMAAGVLTAELLRRSVAPMRIPIAPWHCRPVRVEVIEPFELATRAA